MDDDDNDSGIIAVATGRAGLRIIFPFAGWTIPAGTAGTDCSASPRATCNSSGKSGCTRPRQPRSPAGRNTPSCSPPGSADRRLKIEQCNGWIISGNGRRKRVKELRDSKRIGRKKLGRRRVEFGFYLTRITKYLQLQRVTIGR